MNEIKQKILQESLKFVPNTGWTKSSILAAAHFLNYPGTIHGLFPAAGYDLVHYFYQKSNKELITDFKNNLNETVNSEQFPADFIYNAIRKRLLMIEPYKDQWPQALALMTLPSNVTSSLANLLTLIDDICYYAGDRSVDLNWYTRRLAIAAVYKTTELYFIQDRSNQFESTWKFLESRISELEQLHHLVGFHGNVNQKLKETFTSAFITARNILGMNH